MATVRNSWPAANGASVVNGSPRATMLGSAWAATRWLRNRWPTAHEADSHATPPHGLPAHPQPRIEASSAPRRPAHVTPQTDLVHRMLQSHRTALLLRLQVAQSLSDEQLLTAAEHFLSATTSVPAGPVLLERWWLDTGDSGDTAVAADRVAVEAAYLDRYAVTNAQFQSFVDSGGYEQAVLWQPAVASRVHEFVDATNRPGPRYWHDGQHPPDLSDHPVIGVNWFEADAYARWAGKRLPTDAEWVRAASWPLEADDRVLPRKYPWGDAFERDRANLWTSGVGGTVPVGEFAAGDSGGGARQLIGNVWEWTACQVQFWNQRGEVELTQPLKSLRGGAFDTYFETQATCQLASGDSPLARKHNIGFRCAIGMHDLIPNISDLLDDEPAAGEVSA